VLINFKKYFVNLERASKKKEKNFVKNRPDFREKEGKVKLKPQVRLPTILWKTWVRACLSSTE